MYISWIEIHKSFKSLCKYFIFNDAWKTMVLFQKPLPDSLSKIRFCKSIDDTQESVTAKNKTESSPNKPIFNLFQQIWQI